MPHAPEPSPEPVPSPATPRRAPGRSRRALLAAALCAGAALPGCRGGDPRADARDGTAAQSGLPEARNPEGINGIEVRVWTYDPFGAPLARGIASFAEAGGIDPGTARKWRDHGFRLVEIPAALVADLEQTLPHIDTVRRVWLGQPTRWSDLTTERLASDGGALGGRSTPVRASLSVRSWIEPGLRRGPIRLELALTGVPLDRTETRPMLMRDLLLTHRLGPGTALAIVPASPEEAWSAAADGEEPGAQSAQDGSQGPADAAASGSGPSGPAEGLGPPPAATPVGSAGRGVGGRADSGPIGPTPDLPISLGESMLITPDRIASRPPRPSRRVIVIVPGAR